MKAITPDDCEWYTPPEILNRVYQVMEIDLDPASPAVPTVKARKHYTKEQNGLTKPWEGNIYLNPPYGREVSKWIDKLTEEWQACRISNAIILIHAKTDTRWFEKLADIAAEICCWKGRITFCTPEGGGGERERDFPFTTHPLQHGHRNHTALSRNILALRHNVETRL